MAHYRLPIAQKLPKVTQKLPEGCPKVSRGFPEGFPEASRRFPEGFTEGFATIPVSRLACRQVFRCKISEGGSGSRQCERRCTTKKNARMRARTTKQLPMVIFRRFADDSPTICPRFAYDLPLVCPWFAQSLPMDCQWLAHDSS